MWPNSLTNFKLVKPREKALSRSSTDNSLQFRSLFPRLIRTKTGRAIKWQKSGILGWKKPLAISKKPRARWRSGLISAAIFQILRLEIGSYLKWCRLNSGLKGKCTKFDPEEWKPVRACVLRLEKFSLSWSCPLRRDSIRSSIRICTSHIAVTRVA